MASFLREWSRKNQMLAPASPGAAQNSAGDSVGNRKLGKATSSKKRVTRQVRCRQAGNKKQRRETAASQRLSPLRCWLFRCVALSVVSFWMKDSSA
jgi:hypothetical protein